MCKEVSRIILKRVIFGAIFVALFVVQFFLPSSKTYQVSNVSFVMVEQDTELNESTVKIEITIEKPSNKEIYGTSKLSFYDSEGLLIEKKSVYFCDYIYNKENTLYRSRYNVNGIVDKIEATPFTDSDDNTGWIVLINIIDFLVILPIFLIQFSYKAKQFNYNGKEFIVFAGIIRHYLKIDGKKVDEKNIMVFFFPITLSRKLEDGKIVEISIAIRNRITIRINGEILE